MKPGLFIGMISGTSRDGADAALVDFENDRPALLHARCTPYPEALRQTLDELLASRARPEATASEPLDRKLGQFFASVARNLVADAGVETRDVTAIGSHGQTVWHEPTGPAPVSLQLGDGDLIARLTGIATVTNFRTADVLCGGQGAPLAPLLHRQIFQDPAEHRAVLNLGGIANLTWLSRQGSVLGYDSGPANCLMDVWAQRHLGEPFDQDGAWAASGSLHPPLLTALLEEPYFALQPPKSTGLERFNAHWLEERLAGFSLPPVDVQRTLAELTAVTVANSMADAFAPHRVLVCGGGARNAFLLQCLQKALPGVTIETTGEHGLHADWVEAVLFAWLARERLAARRLDTRAITGARKPVLLGDIHRP